MKRDVDISIYATSVCNRNCAHCSEYKFHSQKPAYFSRQMAGDLMDSAKDKDRAISICLTGGGEPLMSPELVPVVETFIKDSQVAKVRAVTSGFLSKDGEEGKRLSDLFSLQRINKLVPVLSFNCFSPTFPERLENSLRAFLKSSEVNFVVLWFCVTLDNFDRTINGSADVIEKLEKELDIEVDGHIVDYYSHEFEDSLDLFSARFFSKNYLDILTCEAYSMPTYFVARGNFGKKVIKIHPFFMSKSGKGKLIKDRTMKYRFSCRTIVGLGANSLHLDFNGFYFPECNCSHLSSLKIGEIGDNLDEVLARKARLSAQLTKRMLSSKKIFPKGSYCCDFCPELMRGITF